MSIFDEDAVSAYVIRKVKLPPGSTAVGDENGYALELLVNGETGKLPKESVPETLSKTRCLQSVLNDLAFIREYTVHTGHVWTHSYKFKRADVVRKTVHTYLCTVSDSDENAPEPYKWVPLDRFNDYVWHARSRGVTSNQLSRIIYDPRNNISFTTNE